MKLAIAQLNYTVGAIESNKTKIISSINQAKEGGAELVVFAEQAISGTKCYNLANDLSFLEACEDALVEIASHCDDITVVVGLPIRDRNKTISVVAVIQNRIVIRYIGKHLSQNGLEESPYVHPSEGFEYINVNGNRVVVAVGVDSYNKELYGGYADIVLSIWASQFSGSAIYERYDWIKSYAYESGKTIAFVNHLGGQADMIYDGSSCVYNKRGKPIAFLKSFKEELLIVDTESTKELPELRRKPIENIYNALILGLSDYFEKNGFTKACLGLSGGIDSAVVLALAVEVLGPKNVKVLLMPSQFSSDHSVEDAVDMVENLGVEYHVIPITESYKVILDTMKPVIGSTKFDVTEENVQARIRATMLMALSNKFGYILLNTSNKSEDAVGYGTLYGDLAGSLSVIGDLYKNEVYGLARHMNKQKRVIPENIMQKEPSAELAPNQKDSDSLPPYDVLDAILYRYIENRQPIEEIVNAGFDKEVVSGVIKMVKRFEFKRRQTCPALKVSRRPFSASGFKLPLISKF